MSRKDYILLAEHLVHQIKKGYIKKKYIGNAISDLSLDLKNDNHRFSFDTFSTYVYRKLNE